METSFWHYVRRLAVADDWEKDSAIPTIIRSRDHRVTPSIDAALWG
jgi:hypothetical protein